MQKWNSAKSDLNTRGHVLNVAGGLVMSLMLVATALHAETEPIVTLDLDSSTTLIINRALNGMPAGTKFVATPSFHEYSLAPLVDGIKNRKNLDWKDGSWASKEDSNPHGIEIEFGDPIKGGRFQVTWAHDIYNPDRGHWWISRHYVIQVKAEALDDWKTVISVQNNQSAVGSYPLPEEAISFLRIYQLPLGGHVNRPNIMWIGQIEIVE